MIMLIKNTIVANILFSFNIYLNCLIKPDKNPVANNNNIFDTVYNKAKIIGPITTNPIIEIINKNIDTKPHIIKP